jgi:peptidoglycan/xylan/chitin deacetylase (PgdA/CDA1 family)
MSFIRTAGKVAFSLADLFLPRPKGPRVLIYHQVGAGLGRQMEVTVDHFTGQLDWLAANREVVALDEAIDRWDEPGSDHLVAVTFDDGYRDVHTAAYPLLRERGFPFLIYLATESIETGIPLGPPGADPLDWDQIVDMLGSGLVTIGAHTHRHTDLRSMPADAIEEELATCDELVDRRLGVRPAHFAYPWGHWSHEAAALVDRRYSTAAIAATPRPPDRLDPHRLHRYPIQLSDGLNFFPARIRGGLRLEEVVRRRLDGYSGP